MTRATTVIRKNQPGHNDVRGALRFLTELIAWITVPWAMWPHSTAVAIGAVLLLIGLPAVLSTPGDRPGGDAPVPVPGMVTILLVLIQLVAIHTQKRRLRNKATAWPGRHQESIASVPNRSVPTQ